MNLRRYNAIYHTHTVSSIIISVALYIIFFAGSFAFFRDEIVNWERSEAVLHDRARIGANLDTLVYQVGQDLDLYSRNLEFSQYFAERNMGVNISAVQDATLADEAEPRSFYYLDKKDYSTNNYLESYTLGEFLYRLHFFAQIPYPFGYFLAGLVAFFFLFAVVTGLIIHWNKIISALFVFRPGAKWKTVWSDSHTALGLISFPFQFIYALTGAYYMLRILVVSPLVMGLYGGDDAAFEAEYRTAPRVVYEFAYSPLASTENLQRFVDQTKDRWPAFEVASVSIVNFGDAAMHVSVSGRQRYGAQMTGRGFVTYSVATGEVSEEVVAELNDGYAASVNNYLYRLHRADYAGYGLRIVSFVLGLIGCYVILSGVMIWLVARDKKATSDKRKRLNAQTVRWYLAICLGMFPAVALAFVIVRFHSEGGYTFVNTMFFSIWLVFILILYLLKSNRRITYWSILSGGVIGLCVPVVNGLVTGDWLWQTWSNGKIDLALIDTLWLILSLMSIWAARRIGSKPK